MYEIESIEYKIRRLERGLLVLLRGRIRPHTEAETKHSIMTYAKEIASLKKQLYKLTGRCTPSTPKWPV